MIDNFELIKPLFYFNEANNMFFHLQLICRKKEHNTGRDRVKKIYFVTSKDYLDKIKGEVISLCEYYRARAYINPTAKYFENLQKLLLYKLVQYNLDNIVVNPLKIVNSAAGELNGIKKRWVIDIDDISKKDSIIETITNIHLEKFKYLEIPTKNGVHIISPPFNLLEFKKVFPDVDVQKNAAGTLLYLPNSLCD